MIFQFLVKSPPFSLVYRWFFVCRKFSTNRISKAINSEYLLSGKRFGEDKVSHLETGIQSTLGNPPHGNSLLFVNTMAILSKLCCANMPRKLRTPLAISIHRETSYLIILSGKFEENTIESSTLFSHLTYYNLINIIGR